MYNEIYCCIFDVVGLYFCWRSWTSCLDTWHHALYQISTDKNQQVTDSVRNLIMGHVWIFQPYNNSNTNLKNNTKMGHWAQNQASAIMAFPVFWPEPCRRWVLWPEPCRTWVRWPEEAPSWSCESKGSGEILDEGMVSDLVSGVLWPEPCRTWVRWPEEEKLWIWRVWSDSGWRNDLWSLVRCSLTSSGVIGEHLELLNWQMKKSTE